jgi:hypothetical protein
MQGKLFKNIKWGIGTWSKGTVVTIIQISESHPDKVKIERYPGSPTAWIYLDDMESLE